MYQLLTAIDIESILWRFAESDDIDALAAFLFDSNVLVSLFHGQGKTFDICQVVLRRRMTLPALSISLGCITNYFNVGEVRD